MWYKISPRIILESVFTKILLAAVAGALIAILSLQLLPGSLHIYNDCNKEFPLTSPTLDCDYNDVVQRLTDLDATLNRAIEEYKKKGMVTDASVWIRDLESRQWAAVHATTLYSPASLLKVPILIAYYKVAQLDATLLTQQVMYQPQPGSYDPTMHFTESSSLVAGNIYSVNDLLSRMIQHSDNGAALTLYERLGQQNFANLLIDLGINIPTADKPIDFVTVKSYANIFRMLYGASYLNREYSQKALDLMTGSSFEGIPHSLPDAVTASHKFGERTITTSGDPATFKRELHDCGVIYAKAGAYTLCIMTQGTNFDDQLSVIQTISKIAYDALEE